MKKNILRGAGALLLSAAILCGAAGTGTAAVAGSPSEPQPQQLNAAVLSAAVPGKAAGKDETVYIIADAAGQPGAGHRQRLAEKPQGLQRSGG